MSSDPGTVAPLYEAIEFGVADKFMIRAISRAYEIPETEVNATFKKLGDLGATAQELAKGETTGTGTHQQSLLSGIEKKKPAGSLTIQDVYATLDQVARASGPGSQERKVELLIRIFMPIRSHLREVSRPDPLGQ